MFRVHVEVDFSGAIGRNPGGLTTYPCSTDLRNPLKIYGLKILLCRKFVVTL